MTTNTMTMKTATAKPVTTAQVTAKPMAATQVTAKPMAATHKVLMAGFGGQGVMLMGELLAYAAMVEGKQVTYMPSYGPEMRGGTANCSIIISDKEISSPIVTESTILIAMNEPSMDKFEAGIAPEGVLFANGSLIQRNPRRSDIQSFSVDCNALAQSILNEKISNIVMLGAVISAAGIVSVDAVGEAMNHKFTGRKSRFIPMNMEALSAWRRNNGKCCNGI